jgi:hypothetical protein
MSDRNRLNKLSGSAYDFVCKRWEALLSSIHIRVLARTAVPVHVDKISTSHTDRETPDGVYPPTTVWNDALS